MKTKLNDGIFRSCLNPIRQLSKDDSPKDDLPNGNPFDGEMTSCDLRAVDFDGLKKRYVRQLQRKKKNKNPRSADALALGKDDGPVLIEFKNGRLDDDVIAEIEDKMRDSVIILSDILKVSISEIRETTDFVLVYNKEKNRSLSSHLHVRKKAKRDPAISVLEWFQGYCFKNVLVYSAEDFERCLVPRLRSY